MFKAHLPFKNTLCEVLSDKLRVLYFFFRVSEQDFAEIHGNIRRGDIIGVKGKPGEHYVDFLNILQG